MPQIFPNPRTVFRKLWLLLGIPVIAMTLFWFLVGHLFALFRPTRPVVVQAVPPTFLSKAAGPGQTEHLFLSFLEPGGTSKVGRERINVEPGCIVTDAAVTSLGPNRLSLEFLDEDFMSKQALDKLGLKSKKCVIVFESPAAANRSGRILDLREN